MTDKRDSLIPETTERPLVTFALFAYNQEKYIREAVEGAFSQTYEPLEIILSDDCSTDRTFEIMQEMAAEYKRPHRVIARQSHDNRGLGRHIADVAEMAMGKYIIVAAGDDISLPERTTEMVAMMQTGGIRFAESNYNRMTDEGLIEAHNLRNNYCGNYVWQIVSYDSSTFASGNTAAYDTEFLRGALDAASNAIATGYLFNEDILMALYAVATGEQSAKYQKAALVNYRINPNSLSNFIERRRNLEAELSVVRREAFRSRTRLAVLDAAIEIAEKYPRLRQYLNHDRITADRRRAMVEISASENNFRARICGLFATDDLHEAVLRLVRLPGPHFHASIRLVASFWKKK